MSHLSSSSNTEGNQPFQYNIAINVDPIQYQQLRG